MKNLFKVAAAAMVLVSATYGCSTEANDEERFSQAKQNLTEGNYKEAYFDLSQISNPSRISGYADALKKADDEFDDATFGAAKKEITNAIIELSKIHRPSRFKEYDALLSKVQLDMR